MALISRVRQGAALRALITAALLMSAVTLQGQETSGRVTGVVADSTGAVIPGATVTLKDGQTGMKVFARGNRSRSRSGLGIRSISPTFAFKSESPRRR
jgi:galactitol-specific phosphotransferase system IIC component